MQNFRRVAALAAVVSVGCGLAATGIAACSGDDTVTTAGDSGLDQQTPPPPPTDGGSDAEDGSTVDVVVPPDLVGFAESMATTMCTRFAQCCAQTDGGPFDQAKCKQNFIDGWELSGGDFRTGVDASAVNYDQAKAKDCLGKILTFSCPVITSAEFKAITGACFGAATGTLPPGSQCHGSVECVSTAYCDKSDAGDGGAGSCSALLATSADCNGKPAEACSYRAIGAFCDDTTKKCTPPLANGTDCSSVAQSEGCQSGLCDDNFQCGSQETIVYPPFGDPNDGGYQGFCQVYRPDGG